MPRLTAARCLPLMHMRRTHASGLGRRRGCQWGDRYGHQQENASYPAYLCGADAFVVRPLNIRCGIGNAGYQLSQRAGVSDRPIAPCGICRQSLQEFEQRTRRPMRVVLEGWREGIVLPESRLLLPLAFTGDELK